MKSCRFSAFVAIVIGLCAGLWPTHTRADGNDNLGAPSITIAPGNKILIAGEGLVEDVGNIVFTVPAGATINQVLIYWEGQDSPSKLPPGAHDTMEVFGGPVKGQVIGGPYQPSTYGGEPVFTSTYRADITDLVATKLGLGPGEKNIPVDVAGFTLNTGRPANDGAGVLVILDDGTGNEADIQVLDGNDYAYVNGLPSGAFQLANGFAGDGTTTVKQTFNFEPAAVARTAELLLMVSSVQGSASGPERPSVIEVTAGSEVTRFVDLLQSNDGSEWDSVRLTVTLPAGSSSVSVQLLSEDAVGGLIDGLPASLVWITATLSIPTPLAKIGDFVWEDRNANGIQDPDEPGIAGVRVQLYRCSDNKLIGTKTTNLNGRYLFTVPAGQYYVKFTAPTGYAFSPQDQGTNDNKDSDPNPSTGVAICTTLETGEIDRSWDAGLIPHVPAAAIGDFVWEDLNGNGVQDPQEPGIPGVTVQLLNCSNQVLDEQATTAQGEYLFAGLMPGSYRIRFIAPTGYAFSPQDQGGNNALDSDADQATGLTVCTTLDPGETDLTWDAGLYRPACIGDFVWDDKNANGIQDSGEPGIPGVTVELYDCRGNKLDSMLTGANGFYEFCELQPGDYSLLFTRPDGYVFTGRNLGGNDCKDSDADASGKTECTQLTSGERDDCWDTGLHKLAGLGDFVWEDLNANGIQERGEPGIKGVTVELYDCKGNKLATTVTDDNGFYLFSGLKPGDYNVKFLKPAGYVFSPLNAGGDPARDSDADPTTGAAVCTTLIENETDLTWDAGLYKPACIGDLVWDDKNANGIQDTDEIGIAGVMVQLRRCGDDSLVTSMVTSDKGEYLFCDLVPGDYYLVFAKPDGYVFTDQDKGPDDCKDSDANPRGRTICTTLVSGEIDKCWDTGLFKPASLGDFVWEDVNRNGIQEAREPGIPGVKVELYDCTGNKLAETTTGPTGFYLFSSLKPGDYRVKFIPPAGYVFTLLDQGSNDGLDSDADPGTGQTVCTTLVEEENDLSWDAGLYRTACIGDFVWEDLNANGIQERGEPGIGGVTVELYTCSGRKVASTTTLASGFYQFCNLVPGAYSLVFIKPNGYVITKPNQSADDCLDSDADPATGATECTTLLSGEVDNCWDTGLYKLASLGDYVWEDTNKNGVQDNGEPAIPRVTVNLLNCGGTVLATATTGADGKYLFANLTPDRYAVQFVAPTGFTFTQQNVGNDATDSDADPATGLTICTDLVSGENDLTWDAGLVRCPPGLELTKVPLQTIALPGGLVTYQYLVKNTGCTMLTDVVVTDDNGTPDYAADDFIVGTVPSLAAGEEKGFLVTKYLPIRLCGPAGTGEAGWLITQLTPQGNIRAVFIQSRNRNDNTYGANAIGWGNKGHTFGNLTGSDHAVFSFRNGAGQEVLKFKLDYISASTKYPSGYGTLGVSGGDGGMQVGSAANVLAYSSSLTENLNQEPFLSKVAQYTVNSPALTDPNSSLWEYRMIYDVTVSQNAFGASGFGSVAIVDQHNSPPKTDPSSFEPTPCGDCVVNTATATAKSGSTELIATAEAEVCVPETPKGCPKTDDEWKKTAAAGWPAPYTPATPLSEVYAPECLAVAKVATGVTLYGALDGKGGKGDVAELLKRGTAGLLNAADPRIAYPTKDPEQVAANISDLLCSGDGAMMKSAAALYDAENSVDCEEPPNCDTAGKPNWLKLTFNGGSCADAVNSQQAISGKYACTDYAPLGTQVFIVASSTSSGTPNTGFFAGTVNLNQAFEVKGGFGANTYFYLYTRQGGTLLQKVQLHTSCSAPLIRGETFGGMTLDDYAIVP